MTTVIDAGSGAARLQQCGHWLRVRSRSWARIGIRVLLAAIFAGPVSGLSQTAAELRDHDRQRARERAAAPELVRAFAEVIGCNVGFDPANVMRWHGNPEVRYIALVTLDAGCSGGSRSWRPVFVALRAGAHGKLYVNPAYSAPEFTSPAFPQVVDSIFSVGTAIHFAARSAMPGDPDSHPSQRWTGTVMLTASGWSFHRDAPGMPPAG